MEELIDRLEFFLIEEMSVAIFFHVGITFPNYYFSTKQPIQSLFLKFRVEEIN